MNDLQLALLHDGASKLDLACYLHHHHPVDEL